MEKIKIAFIKYGGLSSGGTERWLQTMAANLPRDQFYVDYYYCDATPYIGSDFQHPDTDPYRKKYMLKNNVNLIKFHVGKKDITTSTHEWIDTDFWKIFDESKYDIIQTGRAGHSEYPFTKIKKSIVDYLTLSAGVDYQKNIAWSIHLSAWQRKEWINAGGSKYKSSVIPIPVFSPVTKKDFRKKLGIPINAIVLGMHQRVNNEIYSYLPLRAYKEVANSKTHFIMLGGGDKYQIQAKKLKLKNVHFLDHSANETTISQFLNTLDIYTHGRKDGETFGAVLAEAMVHSIPCISHFSKTGANAQPETMGEGGFFVRNIAEYASKLKVLIDDPSLRKEVGDKGRLIAQSKYTVQGAVSSLASLYAAVSHESSNSNIIIDMILNKLKVIFRFKTHTSQVKNDSHDEHDQHYQESDSINHHKNIYRGFDKQNLFNNPQLRFLDIINANKRLSIVIDIGAGAGWVTSKLSKYIGRVYAIEPSRSAKKIFDSLYPKLSKSSNLTWITGYAEEELLNIKLDDPALFVTSTVLSHLRDIEVKKICRSVDKIAKKGSVIAFSECFGRNEHCKMWHIRTREWWEKQLLGWELDFFGTSINDAGDQFKGFSGVKK